MTPMPFSEAENSGERVRTYRGDPEYLRRDCVRGSGTEVVRAGAAWGTRWRHAFLRFERHTSDAEPVPDPDAPFRLVVWQPSGPTVRPKGWMRGTRAMGIGLTGYAVLKDDYEKSWPSHARRHLAHWRKQVGWEIVECDASAFLDAYRRSTQDAVLRLMFSSVLKEKVAGHGERVRLTVARHAGRDLAGFACVDVPETGESLHLLSFIQPDAREASAGMGLMDQWFRTAAARGIRYLDFGIFWRKGDPASWKGFSRFKGQFVGRYVDYPAPFLRFAGRWGSKK
jgi:hypothetical protein